MEKMSHSLALKKFFLGKNTAIGKYFIKADRIYLIINSSFLAFDYVTSSTFVFPGAFLTLKNYIVSEEMPEDQWIRPFYVETFSRIDNIWKYSILITISTFSIYAFAIG